MGVNILPKIVTNNQQCRDSHLNPGLTGPESSMLTTQLLGHLLFLCTCRNIVDKYTHTTV